jgi:predicted nucleic acid-binding protein
MRGHPLTPAEAFQKYRGFTALTEVSFIGDAPQLDQRIEPWASESFFSGKLWTDAWIAALAMEHGCRVVSFDADFARFPGLNLLHLKP